MKRNIGVLVSNDYNNDIRVTKEVDILESLGYQVFILCYGYSHKNYEITDTINRIKISKKISDILFFLFNLFPFFELLWIFKAKKFIKKNDIQILHVHDLYMAKIAKKAVLNQKNKIPIVLDLHENFPVAVLLYNWTKGRFRNFFAKPIKWQKKEKEYLSYADYFIVLSEKFRDELLAKYKHLKLNQFLVFPNVIDFKKFESFDTFPITKDHDLFTFLYFGGVAERRGVFDMIDAVAEFNKENLKVKFLIIGPVDKSDQERFSRYLLRYKESIDYIQWIDLKDLPSYINACDVCVSPLHKNDQHESGVANKIYQYMFGEKPLLVSDCLPQKQLVDKAKCGVSFSTDGELLERINWFLNNKKSLKKLGENGKEYLYDHFNDSITKNKLKEFYKIFKL